jgi:hypothetical protein
VPQHLACQVKLDRFQVLAQLSAGARTPRIPSFRVVSDSLVRSQTKIKTYARVRQYLNPSTGTRIFLQYQPLLPGLSPFKATVIGYDCRRLSRREIQRIVRSFKSYRLLLVEVAWDFDPRSGVDIEFVQHHAVFGKCRPNVSRLFPGSARYGTRKGDKFVRCYWKQAVGCFRVELELHSRWLRRNRIVKVDDLRKLPRFLYPKHIRFVRINWTALDKYLCRRRLAAKAIILRAKTEFISVHQVMEFLRRTVRVNNPTVFS